jgi:hypothetical protein
MDSRRAGVPVCQPPTRAELALSEAPQVSVAHKYIRGLTVNDAATTKP